MNTMDFIITLFWQVDERIGHLPKHPQAHLYPSELVTIALLFALKGVGNRAFYRWLSANYATLFGQLPERTRLFRLFQTHADWTDYFLALPTVLGVTDTYGIELIHPIREGRSPQQIGKKGLSNHRWIVGAKLALVLNQWGLVCAWDCDTANTHDNHFQPLVAQFQDQMIVLSDNNFHAKTGDPSNLKLCPKGEWNQRMLVETIFSMLTVVCHFKHMRHRTWAALRTRLGFTMAAFNLLIQWDGLQFDDNGILRYSIAWFAL